MTSERIEEEKVKQIARLANEVSDLNFLLANFILTLDPNAQDTQMRSIIGKIRAYLIKRVM